MRVAIVLACLVALVPTAGALLVSLPGSCVTTGAGASCGFSCALGDSLVVAVLSERADTPSASASCGGATVGCSQYLGCVQQSAWTTTDGQGACVTRAVDAITVCVASASTQALSTAALPSCTVTTEGSSCAFWCVETELLLVSAHAASSAWPASGDAQCGGAEAYCYAAGSCAATSSARVAFPLAIGMCRAFTSQTTVTCGSRT